MSALAIQPIDFAEACAFVNEHHRHHVAPVGHKFTLAVRGPLSLDETIREVRAAWSADTSASSAWTPDNPALGQCAVTSLVLHDRFGGVLLRCLVNGASHYFNRLGDGSEIDATASQFADGADWTIPEERDREYVLSYPDTVARYERLRARVPEGKVVGVIICGRPVARRLDDGWTIEVTRCCTDGTEHAASKLYAAARRVARELGYRRCITYTLAEEPGTSLRAAGWERIGTSPGRSWSVPSRPRVDKHPLGQKVLWEIAALDAGEVGRG